MGLASFPLAVAGAVASQTAISAIVPDVLIEGMQQLYRSAFPVTIPEIDLLVMSVNAGYIKFEDYLKLMKKRGYKEDFARIIFNLVKPRASIADTIRAYFYYMGHEAPEDEVWRQIKYQLQARGYDETEINKIIFANKFLPSLSDLLQWMAKEAFEDDIAKELGLDEELPPKFIEYGRRMGIPEQDLRRYWRAHWGMASWTQVAEAFHRARAEGYRRGNYDTVMQQWRRIWNIFYRQAEIPRFYRDMLTNITYSVITRVDARRMYEMGFLTDRELASIFIAQGYTKEDAERMVAWIKWETQRYGEEDLRGLTRSHVESLYELGVINDKEFLDLMKKVGVGQETAEYLLAIKKQKLFEKRMKTQMNTIKTLYRKGKLSKDVARQELIRLGIDHEIADLYLAEWETEKTEVSKELSKEDIQKAVRQGIFDLSTAYRKLREIGYDHDDSVTLLRIWGATAEQIRGLMLELQAGGWRA